MRLTSEQKEAVGYNGSLSLVSCPGSGKTRTIVARLVRCVEEMKETTRRAACITYTNAGVNEIQYRLSRQLGRDEFEDKVDVGTIHAFCLQNIFRPHHWRLPVFKKGFEVLPPDDERYMEIVSNIIHRNALDRRAVDEFELLFRGQKRPLQITQQAADDYWNCLDENRYVDFNGIIYYSAQLTASHTFIPAGLAAAYQWMLVDEFQDTSESQVQILTAVASFGRTKFFIVGDPNQSIMSFAGARPELMAEFSHEVSAKDDLSLSGNFRSSDKVISLAERLLPRTPPMAAVGDNRGYDFTPRWIETSEAFVGLREQFLPAVRSRGIDWGECAVLAPNFYILCAIAPKLRDEGIPLIGPGARPYKKSSHLIAALVEDVSSYIDDGTPRMLRSIRMCIRDLIDNCESRWNPKLFTFDGDIAIAKIIDTAKRLRNNNALVKDFLIEFAVECASILGHHGLLRGASGSLLEASSLSMIEDIKEHKDRSGIDIDRFTVSQIGMFARGDRSVKLLTLHKAKGREFDAVAVVEANDGRIPYGNPGPDSDQENEARRLLYVAITRARKVLMVFSNENNWRGPSRFLSEIF